MLPTSKFFVPRDEILKLTKGSFEQLAVRVDRAVQSEKARLFEGANVEVLGTFTSHAVVLTDGGKVFHTRFEESASGELRLISASEMDAVVVPRDSMPKFLKKEARAVADLFLKGLVDEANRRMSQLAKLVDADAVFDDRQVVESFVAELTRDSGWRTLVETTDIRRVLGEGLEKISANKLRAKFFKLYDGSLSGAELEKYRGLVNEDLGHLMQRIEAVREQTLESVSRLREVAAKVDESKQETVRAFEDLVTEFSADLVALPGAFSETVQGVEAVGALGKLYDAVAEELLRYEVAGAFVVQMTNRLATAS